MNLSDFHVAAENWLTHKKKKTATLDAYRRDLKKLTKFLSERAAQEINVAILTDYFKHLDQQGFSRSTMLRQKSALSSLFKFAQQKAILAGFDELPVYKAPLVRRTIPIDSGDIEKLLHDNHLVKSGRYTLWVRDVAMFHLLYNVGLQLDELLDLQLGDLDLQQGLLNIRGRKCRQAELGPQLIEDIESWLQERNNWGAHDDTLFISLRTRKALKRNAVSVRLRLHLKKKQIDSNIHPRALSGSISRAKLKKAAEV